MKLRQAAISSTDKFFVPRLSLGNSNVQISTAYQTPLLKDFKRLLVQVLSSLKLSAVNFGQVLKEVVEGVGDFATEKVTSSALGILRRLSRRGSALRYNFPKRKFLKILLIALVIVGLALAARAIYSLRNSASSINKEVLGAKASQPVNKEITFPLRDEEGKELSTISYLVEKAELMDQILVKGEKATAIQGRTFLIFTVKIKNDYDKSIEINTKDYIRLRIAGQEELLAPDIHNDPVTVQAISTKYTKLGFPINDSDRQVTLQLGEINGPKETVEIKF
ncbi:MAG: hypothetical protein UX19_C0009G0004 [Candidatus Woesebacteria bacterium GW2011_GWA1_45_8]|uniref:DUF4352 domain-containing protein n=1 Tax=Candidatus Woesebacteria bacterium GW2011_GWA1_45_8 TaxID=1618559 RepID=A0A0G1MUW7_9BACT|nr:MAG: hypothetical protein UX19_C0009G0004 [Candidatus Woesebacteria bacterium GW2011_GWA1_45_8]